MKKVLLTLLVLVMIFTLSACSIECDYKIDKKGNLTGTVSQTYMADDMRTLALMACETEKEQSAILNTDDDTLIAAMLANITPDDENAVVKIIETNGKKGICMSSDIDAVVTEDITETGYIYDATKFTFTNPDGYVATSTVTEVPFDASETGLENMLSTISSTIRVTMPQKIVYTNGKLSKDKKTVTWDEKNNPDDITIYAYTADAEELVKLSNIKKGNVIYKESAKVTALSKIKAIYVNGEKVKSKNKITFPTDGEYTIKVKTKDYTKTITVTKKTK